jgi:hypothetical protein
VVEVLEVDEVVVIVPASCAASWAAHVPPTHRPTPLAATALMSTARAPLRAEEDRIERATHLQRSPTPIRCIESVRPRPGLRG